MRKYTVLVSWVGSPTKVWYGVLWHEAMKLLPKGHVARKTQVSGLWSISLPKEDATVRGHIKEE